MQRTALTGKSGRRPWSRRLPLLAFLALAMAGCGGTKHQAATTTTTAATAGTSITTSARRVVTFAGLNRAIDQLYEHQPTIRAFVVQDVEYTPKTRDKVLTVCHVGGPETDRAALESAKIAGCAPLVFFFYKYGRQKAVPESLDVARQVYWYAATNIHGPFSARTALTTLLQSWGIP